MLVAIAAGCGRGAGPSHATPTAASSPPAVSAAAAVSPNGPSGDALGWAPADDVAAYEAAGAKGREASARYEAAVRALVEDDAGIATCRNGRRLSLRLVLDREGHLVSAKVAGGGFTEADRACVRARAEAIAFPRGGVDRAVVGHTIAGSEGDAGASEARDR